MMGKIYRRASQVFVWLGEEGHDSSFAMSAIIRINENPYFGLVKDIALSNGPNREQVLKTNLDILVRQFDLNRILSAVGHLTQQEWWFRLWVVQEVSLAKTAFLKCGQWITSWISFYNFALLCDWFVECHPTATEARDFIGIRSQATMTLACSANIHNGHSMTLLYLLGVLSVTQKTSDFRDRVYALLSLADDRARLNFELEYHLPWFEVYANTAIVLLRGYGPSILSYCIPWAGHHADPRLPSWVPDWHIEIHRPLRGLDNMIFRYNTSGDFKDAQWTTKREAESQILCMNGAIFDNISWLGIEVLEGMSFEDPRVQKAMTTALQHFYGQYLQDSSVKTRHPILPQPPGYEEQAIWRTPIANQIQRAGASEPYRVAGDLDFIDIPKLISNDMSPLLSEDSPILAYCWSLWRKMPGRRLFRTASGYVGLGNRALSIGDFICVFPGADVPFVLRLKSNDCYTLVGEAYIHGIMEGEFMNTSPEMRMFEIE
jgi:hypothetical protein